MRGDDRKYERKTDATGGHPPVNLDIDPLRLVEKISRPKASAGKNGAAETSLHKVWQRRSSDTSKSIIGAPPVVHPHHRQVIHSSDDGLDETIDPLEDTLMSFGDDDEETFGL